MKKSSTLMKSSIQALVHLFCLALYLIPIFEQNVNAGPTLDELHIMSKDNQDIHGEATLQSIFSNDYWGRPMVSEASHKSWRPLTVLSFRYLKGIDLSSELTMHRCVNIITHAAAAEVVGILATRLFPQRQNLFLLQMITKIVFILHPTHVEVTANAANRNHILAVLFSTILCDPSCPLLLLAVALISGFLCSETFLFQVPAAAVTLVVLQYSSEKATHNNQTGNLSSAVLNYVRSALAVLPRLTLMIISICAYLGGRYYFDTLDIPEGLIRPAENPFYHFKGEHRFRNYLYTLAVHVFKSWGLVRTQVYTSMLPVTFANSSLTLKYHRTLLASVMNMGSTAFLLLRAGKTRVWVYPVSLSSFWSWRWCWRQCIHKLLWDQFSFNPHGS